MRRVIQIKSNKPIPEWSHREEIAAKRRKPKASIPKEEPIILKESSQCKRKRRELQQGIGWSEDEWNQLLEQWNYQCLKCGNSGKLVADHVIPLFRGGEHSINNIQPLCSECNLRKGIQIIDYRTPIEKGRGSFDHIAPGCLPLS